jgi:hypothetical protein
MLFSTPKIIATGKIIQQVIECISAKIKANYSLNFDFDNRIAQK